MTLEMYSGLRAARRMVAATALLALTAGAASAQMVFSGNVVWNNNASGTFAGQFVGAPSGAAITPSGPCPLGYSAAVLGTDPAANNLYSDPLLDDALYKENVVPSFRPKLGSPAYGHAVTVPADGFFQQTCYAGAIGPRPEDDWTEGWTYWDSTGANRHDLHLASNGDPDPRPNAVYNNISIYGHPFWSPDSNYEIFGQLRIKSQATLSIPPGVVVREDFPTLGTIIVERGGRLYAIGTKCNPIIVTTNVPPGQMDRGQCGGIVINGYAKSNSPIVGGVGIGTCNGDSIPSEGGAIGYYGGNNDNDNSGTLRYVRVEYSGKEITPNNELNSFTWNACGHQTHGDYLEAFNGADDSFEWFGGAMDQKYLLAVDGTDDGYDWQLGTRNRAQFVIVHCIPICAPEGCTQFGDKGIEADNNEFDFNTVACSGRSNTTIANMTVIGDKRSGTVRGIDATHGPTSGVNFRRGTAGQVLNSIFFDMKTAALKVDDDATWIPHCNAIPAPPGLFCPGALGVTPITSGSVFVARSQPNPFRSRVNFSFTLPQSGQASVEIFSADGRHVATVAKGQMAAGQHEVSWTLDKNTPAGMYFYRVVAGNNESTGKITRLN